MAGFTYPTSTVPTVGQQILREGATALMQLAQTRIRNYKRFWADPVNVAAQLGTSATAVFQADAALVAFLGPQLTAAGAPSNVIADATQGPPSTWTVTYNADGTITLTATTGH